MNDNLRITRNYPSTSRLSKNPKFKTEIVYENCSEINYENINGTTTTTMTKEPQGFEQQQTIRRQSFIDNGRDKLVLKLGTEKILLKSQQQQQQQQSKQQAQQIQNRQSQQQQQQQLINKSILTETEAQATPTTSASVIDNALQQQQQQQQQKPRRFSFSIGPRQTPSSSSSASAQLNTPKNLPEIKLASVKRVHSAGKRALSDYKSTTAWMPTPPPPPPPPPPLPQTPIPTPTHTPTPPPTQLSLANNSLVTSSGEVAKLPPLPPPPSNFTTEVCENLHDSLDSSDANSQTGVVGVAASGGTGGNSTSPESLLDNILSAASSVSVQSSSSSSTAHTISQFGAKPTATRAAIARPSSVPMKRLAKEMPTNRLLLTLKTASPELRVSPATPNTEPVPNSVAATGGGGGAGGGGGGGGGVGFAGTTHSLHAMQPQTLQLPMTPDVVYDTSSVHSRSPTSPTPSVTIRVNKTEAHNQFPEELKCTICMEPFRDPRTLHCLHTFCFQCLLDENFKQDASLWPVEINDDAAAGNNRSNYSLRSSTPEIALVNPPAEQASVSPVRQRGASFSLRRKKSIEKILLKSKADGKGSVGSSATHLHSLAHEKPRTIECRLCKYQTELPIGGVRQLPQNFMIMRKIEELRMKAGEEVISRVWCSLCYEETNATYHCVNCTLNLCTLCKESHERQRSTSNHRIKNIMELRRARKQKQSALDDGLKFVPKCGLHVGFEMKSFCVTCLQLACADCLVLLHKGHKHETLNKAIGQYAKVLRDSAEQTRPLCNYAEHSIEKLNEIAKNINRKCDRIQAEVEHFMQNYYKAVEVHGKTLLQQVHRARESKVEMILEQQMDLEKRTHEAMEAVRFCQELTDNATDAEILSYVSILLKRFEYCQQFKTPVDPKISDSLHFLSKIRAPSTKEQNDIPLFGIITMQTVEPSLCTLQWEGFSQLRLHKKVDLLLLSRDADGSALCHGGLQLQCVIKYKESNSRYLPIEVSDHRDGTYSVSFSPDAQGTIILTITINDKPIKGSPFTFLARQVRPHSGIYHCCAFCSSKGNKIVKCSCEGRMPGYNGCGHGHAGHPGRRHWSCCGNVLENSECNVANKLLNT